MGEERAEAERVTVPRHRIADCFAIIDFRFARAARDADSSRDFPLSLPSPPPPYPPSHPADVRLAVSFYSYVAVT